MKQLKKLALAAVLTTGLVAGFSSAAFAGGGKKHKHEFGGEKMFQKLDGMTEEQRLEFFEDKVDKRVTQMTQNLDLTKAQQTKVRQIIGDAQTQLLEVYEKYKVAPDKTAARGEAQAILKQSHQDVADILTDEQKAKAKELRQQRRGKMQGKMLDRMDEKLNLDDAQRAKIAKIMEGTHAKVKALHDSGVQGDELRAKAKELREASANDIAKVLTKEQQVEFAKMREQMAERGSKRGRKGPDKDAKRGAF